MNKTKISLKRMNLMGFKSIKQMDLELRALNILIGANGAGKSNLLKSFELIRALTRKKSKQYVERSGGAAGLLFGGPKQTNKIEFRLLFELLNENMEYSSFAEYKPPDSLSSYSKKLKSYEKDVTKSDIITSLGDECHESFTEIQGFIDFLKVYHFADTTYNASIRGSCYLHDNKSLHADGKNLAAILYRISRQNTV